MSGGGAASPSVATEAWSRAKCRPSQGRRPSLARMVSISPTSTMRNTTFGPTFSEEAPLYRLALLGAGLCALSACSSSTRTVVVEPSPQIRTSTSTAASGGSHHGPSTAATFGVPPGHLPKAGECRVWIPGTPPGQQPGPKSRSCTSIASAAPAGSWVIYRPTDSKKLVHVREVDAHRTGHVVRIRIFDIETHQLVREEKP